MTQINPNIVDMSKMSPADMQITDTWSEGTFLTGNAAYAKAWKNAPHNKESLNTDRKPLLIEKILTNKYSDNVHVNRFAKIATVAAYCLGLLASVFILILGELAIRAIQNSNENKRNNEFETRLHTKHHVTILPSSKEILLLEDRKETEPKPTVCPQEDADTTPTQDNTSSQTTEPTNADSEPLEPQDSTKETPVEQRPVFGPEEAPKTQELTKEQAKLAQRAYEFVKQKALGTLEQNYNFVNNSVQKQVNENRQINDFERVQEAAYKRAHAPTNILSNKNDPATPLMIEDRLFAENGTFLGLPETRHELKTLMASTAGKELTADQEAQLNALLSKAEQEEAIAKDLIASGKKVTTGLLKQQIAIENNQKTYRARVFDKMRLNNLYRKQNEPEEIHRNNDLYSLNTNQVAEQRRINADLARDAARKAKEAHKQASFKSAMDTIAENSNTKLGNAARTAASTAKKVGRVISNAASTSAKVAKVTANGLSYAGEAIATGTLNDVKKSWSANPDRTILKGLAVATAAWASLPLTALAGAFYAAKHVKDQFIRNNFSKVEGLAIEDK